METLAVRSIFNASVPLKDLFLYLDKTRAGGGVGVKLSSFGGSANSLLKSVCFLRRVLMFESRIPSVGIASAFCKHKLWKIFQQINCCASILSVFNCSLNIPSSHLR